MSKYRDKMLNNLEVLEEMTAYVGTLLQFTECKDNLGENEPEFIDLEVAQDVVESLYGQCCEALYVPNRMEDE